MANITNSAKISHPPSEFIKFPSIEPPRIVFTHLENVAHYVCYDPKTKTNIYDKTLPLPVLTFRGTIKLHGANCAMVQSRLSKEEKVTHYQSRHKILTPDDGKDNLGFASHMNKQKEILDGIFKLIFHIHSSQKGKQVKADDVKSIAVYGEWCGGNIQKNIAISQFQKMFIVFAVKISYHQTAARRKVKELQEWMDISLLSELHNEKAHIFNVCQFDTFEVTIDLSSEKSKEDGLRLMKQLTLDVQEECPVAKKFGATGKAINGEGIVWQPIRVASPAKSGSASNLKMEKFASPSCWMKTKDIQPALSSTSGLPNEQQNKKSQNKFSLCANKNLTIKTQEKRKLAIQLPPKMGFSKNPSTPMSSPVKPLSVSSLSTDFLSEAFPSNVSPSINVAFIEEHSVQPLSFDPTHMDSLSANPYTINSLADLLTPGWRMEQGLQFQEREMNFPRHIRCTGPFIEWVLKDVVKEESDRMEMSGLGRKEILVAIAARATAWYLEKLDGDWWMVEVDEEHEG